MKKLIFIFLLSVPTTIIFAQQPQSNSNTTIPPNPDYYDFVQFYLNETAEDTTEGSFIAQLKKQHNIWGERLHPTGNPQIPGGAITDYAKNFNINGSSNCTNGSWNPLGPIGIPNGDNDAKGSGQMHEIKFSPNYVNDGIIYACSNWGGLWRSTNGSAWEMVNTDTQLPFTSVSDIAIDPIDTDILYITTGEAETTVGYHAQNPQGTPSLFTPLFTAGVYRSFDAGMTWESINGEDEEYLCFFDFGGTIRKIRMNPNNNQQLFIATSLGVYRIDDAQGIEPTWTKLTDGIEDLELKGLEFKPNDNQTIYASGTDIYRTTDGGSNWASMTGIGTGLELNNLPDNFGVFRINIAVTPANPDLVYAYIVGTNVDGTCIDGDDNERIDRSSQLYIYRFNGTNWTQIFEFDDTVFGNSCGVIDQFAITPQRTAIVVAPDNENEIYFGTTVLYGSDDYTTNNIKVLSPYLDVNYHADIHGLAFEPNTNNLFAATDGGIHFKDRTQQNNDNASWTQFSDGLAVKTSYRFDDTDDRIDRIIIGNQDTGTDVYENNEWRIIRGGDGFNGKIDGKTGLAFGSTNSYGGTIFSYDFDASTPRTIFETSTFLRPTDPRTGKNLLVRGTYDMVNHPQTEKMYFTMAELQQRQLHRSRVNGDTDDVLWYLRSDIGKYVEEQWRRQQLTELAINEANPDFMLMSMSGNVVDIPPNYGTGYVAEPALFLTFRGGCDGEPDYVANSCWEDITQLLIDSGVKNNSYQPIHPDNGEAIIPVITGIAYDPENPQKAFVCFTGYEPTAKVWMTTNGGQSWTNTDPNESLFNLPVNDIVYQKGTNDMLYIATDAGVYYKDASMTDWVKYCDFPNVRVMELKINYCMGKIRAATFGRGVWEGDLQESDGTLGTTELLIDQNVTWDFSRGLDKNLRVTAGNTLTITTPMGATETTTFSIPKDGKIFVERGARLEITDAILTNNCGQEWRGIQLEGDENAPQIPSNQGVLVMNNVVIENARNAIGANINGTHGGGGIIEATGCTFRNNKRSAEIFPHPDDNVGFFNNCTFEINNDFIFDSFLAHVTMFGMGGLSFFNCTFTNTNSTFRLQRDAVTVNNSDCTFTDGCTFSGFRNGIYVENPQSTILVVDATFSNNQHGIFATDTQPIRLVNIDCNNNDIGVELQSSRAVIECSDFYDNDDYGVRYRALLVQGNNESLNTAPVVAENCWWGEVSGPMHPSNGDGKGDRVSDDIDFDPWSTTLTAACSALPIELIRFTGTWQSNQTVKLSWEVGAEINIIQYEVERSLDGNKWESIGSVNANNLSVYQLIDRHAIQTNQVQLFYRLKIVELDKRINDYSNIIRVELPDNDKNVQVIVQPHPVHQQAQFVFKNVPAGSILQIADLSGRVLRHQNINLEKMIFYPNGLAEGMYLYRLLDGQKVLFVGKLVVTH